MKVAELDENLELDYNELGTLQHLASRGAIEEAITVSTSDLRGELMISAQTVSRRLQHLDTLGLIERERVNEGQRVTVTGEGVEVLKREYEIYRGIFDRSLSLRGTVTTGMGEGRHYISLDGYRVQFEDKLGYAPFAGTLNLQLNEDSRMRRKYLSGIEPVTIEGWEKEDRSFGPVYCYPVTLAAGDAEYAGAHAISPERTSHDDDQLEVIAPVKLREELALKDGDQVTVHVD